VGQRAPVARSLNKCGCCTSNFVGHSRSWRNKFGGKPGKQPDEIMRDQDLAVAKFTRSDADCRDADGLGNPSSCVPGYDFEHYGKGAGFFDGMGILQQLLNLSLSSTFQFVTAL